MSEQHGKEVTAKRRRSQQTSKQNGTQLTPPRPTNEDTEAWKAYWKALGQSWRTEPEIDVERQKYLAERRAITPNIEQDTYPFKNIKLSRADVEWLLATHEDGLGPVDYYNIKLSKRERLDLRGADLSGMDLRALPLGLLYGGLPDWERVNTTIDQCEQAAILLKGADLRWAHLELAYLNFAHLERANLSFTHLENAHLRWAHLEYANLNFAHLERTHLRGAYLGGVNLSEAFLEEARLENAVIGDDKHIGPRLTDVHLSDVNLAVVKWSQITMLGDEYEARLLKRDGVVKERITRISEYEKAVRANRQLAVALQQQGLNEDAARFTYRAQLLQRTVFTLQKKFRQYLFSLFLDLLTGYGYKPWRSFLAYLLVVIAFAIAYFVIGHIVGPVLSPLGSFVFSMTSFHGRGFFPGSNISLDDPLTVLAALEAFVGLLIEVTFIATLTHRLFGK